MRRLRARGAVRAVCFHFPECYTIGLIYKHCTYEIRTMKKLITLTAVAILLTACSQEPELYVPLEGYAISEAKRRLENFHSGYIDFVPVKSIDVMGSTLCGTFHFTVYGREQKSAPIILETNTLSGENDGMNIITSIDPRYDYLFPQCATWIDVK